MSSIRGKRGRGRGRSQRLSTIREIKMAICDHARLAATGPPQQRVAGGVWRTRMTCPACGVWYDRETADSAPAPTATSSPSPEERTPEPVWESCTIELRCQQRGARVYPLCRYDAIGRGPAGLYVAARSVDFDNGIVQAERLAILDAVARDLREAGWELEPDATDGMPRFRRQASAAAGAVAPLEAQ
jgi:hypothetical protein